jgi:hypothetical protein
MRAFWDVSSSHFNQVKTDETSIKLALSKKSPLGDLGVKQVEVHRHRVGDLALKHDEVHKLHYSV